MAYAVKVRLGRVICRNRESLSEHDLFALMGAVVVDGKTTVFERAPIAVNERISGSYGGPEQSQIFSGFSDGRQIGLVLRGYDVDNNAKWKKNRARIQEAMDELAAYIGEVPVVGDATAKILQLWPKVVDEIVELDKDDLLLNTATTVALPDVSPMLFRDSHHEIEVRFKRDDPTGYSDWDYSVFIHFTYSNLDVPSFGRTANESLRPFSRSRAKDWIGTWESEKVTCIISKSPHGRELLDVKARVRAGENSSETESVAVSISKIFRESVAVAVTKVSDFTEMRSKDSTGTSSDDFTEIGADQAFTRLVVERASTSPSAIVKAVLTEPSTATWTLGNSAPSRSIGRRRTGGTSRLDSTSSERIGPAMTVPKREQSGADLLELNGDAVLEIYQVLHDGKRTPGRQLRYVQPVSSLSALTVGAVDEMLRWQLHVG